MWDGINNFLIGPLRPVYALGTSPKGGSKGRMTENCPWLPQKGTEIMGFFDKLKKINIFSTLAHLEIGRAHV